MKTKTVTINAKLLPQNRVRAYDGTAGEQSLEKALKALLNGEISHDDIADKIGSVRTFREDGVMTYNRGVVIEWDGEEYQIRIA